MLGTSGSGKTTFARALGARLGVPHVELDALHHGPGWVEAPAEAFRARVEEAVRASEGWVVDGNYEGKLGDLVLAEVDTVVWLDMPLALSLWRLWWRTIGRIARRTELWNGNRESLRNAFVGRESLFAWAVTSHLRRRRTLPARLARLEGVEVVRLRSPRQASRWLAS